MDTSPFASLCGELRNRIYKFFFPSLITSAIQIDIRPQTGAQIKRAQGKILSALALTATCRQIRQETLAMFWSTASILIVAGTLDSYTNADDSYSHPYLHSLNAAAHTNLERIHNLQKWLYFSDLYRHARFLRPIEVDLGMWDPRIDAHDLQGKILTLLRGETVALLRPLQALQQHGHDNTGLEVSLRFSVRVKASTALGPIRVPNERGKALGAVGELCRSRMASVQAQYDGGLLTSHGHGVLSHDLAMCRSVAEMLVRYAVAEGEAEADCR
ncbi:hypothetical protein Q7P37_001584 [Cladosporium fusiforme]